METFTVYSKIEAIKELRRILTEAYGGRDNSSESPIARQFGLKEAKEFVESYMFATNSSTPYTVVHLNNLEYVHSDTFDHMVADAMLKYEPDYVKVARTFARYLNSHKGSCSWQGMDGCSFSSDIVSTLIEQGTPMPQDVYDSIKAFVQNY